MSSYSRRRCTLKKSWTDEEDNILQAAIEKYQSDWKKIALLLPNRNPSQCSQRWFRIKQVNKIIKNNKWKPEEDQQLKELAVQYSKKWHEIAKQLKNRTERQVRERYINHLDPKIKFGGWTDQEDRLIWETYQKEGTKWSKLSKLLPGRPVLNNIYLKENMIKNRFYSHVKFKYGNVDKPYLTITKNDGNFDEYEDISKQAKLLNGSSTKFLQSESQYILKNEESLFCGFDTISSEKIEDHCESISIYFQKETINENFIF